MQRESSTAITSKAASSAARQSGSGSGSGGGGGGGGGREETVAERERRGRAARILQSYEQIVWFSLVRNEVCSILLSSHSPSFLYFFVSALFLILSRWPFPSPFQFRGAGLTRPDSIAGETEGYTHACLTFLSVA